MWKKNIGVAFKMLHPAAAERQRATVGELGGGEVLLRVRGSRRMSSTMGLFLRAGLFRSLWAPPRAWKQPSRQEWDVSGASVLFVCTDLRS